LFIDKKQIGKNIFRHSAFMTKIRANLF